MPLLPVTVRPAPAFLTCCALSADKQTGRCQCLRKQDRQAPSYLPAWLWSISPSCLDKDVAHESFPKVAEVHLSRGQVMRGHAWSAGLRGKRADVFF